MWRKGLRLRAGYLRNAAAYFESFANIFPDLIDFSIHFFRFDFFWFKPVSVSFFTLFRPLSPSLSFKMAKAMKAMAKAMKAMAKKAMKSMKKKKAAAPADAAAPKPMKKARLMSC